MTCNCITEIDTQLKEKGTRLDLAIMFLNARLFSETYSRLMRLDNGKPETRSGKARVFAHKFCPFCGEPYHPENTKGEGE
jgi:hypothetical protein